MTRVVFQIPSNMLCMSMYYSMYDQNRSHKCKNNSGLGLNILVSVKKNENIK